ncbi:Ankyrin repeat protein [Pandoravirus kuranda]|uniref:Ankyrin repeat protein n=1 Tax=Pandoravirus kuranda TaxID=3019033 RepID=A0AA95EDT1_9VIRU|nr:Ankyrin repeat protein [Pandoravirus kuranda]
MDTMEVHDRYGEGAGGVAAGRTAESSGHGAADAMAIDDIIGDVEALHPERVQRHAQMDDLPNEILRCVILRLQCVERVLIASRVCRRWHAVIKEALHRDGDQCATFVVGAFRHSKATVCKAAARKGHLVCLVRAVARGFPVDRTVAEAAARAGSLACLRYLHSSQCPWDETVAWAATQSGSLTCLRYLHENGCPWDHRVIEDAAAEGHLDCLRYAHEKGCAPSRDAAAYAAQQGHMACLDYILANCVSGPRPRIDGVYSVSCIEAIERFGLVSPALKRRWLADAAVIDRDVLAYLLGHGVEPTLEACECAVSMGTLDTLKLLVDAGRAWDAHLCACAAKNNRPDRLSFLRAWGYKWDERTCAAAVAARSLDCLRYAHENGCPWGECAWSSVHNYTDPSVVAYLTEHGCPRPQGVLRPVSRTAPHAIHV